MEEDRPARVPSPSSIIKRELEARGWSQAHLSSITGFPPSLTALVIYCNEPITEWIATKLALAFGTSVKFWTNLEAAYRAHQS